jgi:WD40 repeat protein
MSRDKTCVEPARLKEHLEGTLGEREQHDVITHLDTCAHCRQALEELASGGEHLLAVARDVGREPPAGTFGGLQDQPSPNFMSEELTLDFLNPGEKPGQLGRLGHYVVTEVIGQGGMGMVLKAIDEKLQRVVAIKVMAPQLAANVTARKRFTREAQAAAAVRYEHIIDVHGVEEANGVPYLVMEYISGPSLQERLDQGGALELVRILRIGMQTAAGLAAAHAQGLIHRDIKPANILLENGVERVKITDFGLARAADDASLTHSGVVAGTPQFMAPEQALGGPIDQRADLFSLGSVLYAMCTGRPPFPGSGALATLKRVCDEEPLPIREINPEIPEWMAAIVARLQAKRPGERFASAAEVADLLDKHLAHLQQPGLAPAPPPLKMRHRRSWQLPALVFLIAIALLSLTEATGVTRLRRMLFPNVQPESRPLPMASDAATPSLSLLDRLDPAAIPLAERFSWQPKELVAVLGEHRGRHWHQIRSVAASPDGKLVASTGWQDIVVADAQTLQPRWIQRKNTTQVNSLSFSPDSRLLLSGSADSSIRLWNVATGEQRLCFREAGTSVYGVCFSPDGHQALSAENGGQVRLWNVDTGKEVKCLNGHRHWAVAVGFSPDNLRAVSGGADHMARVWDLQSGTELCCFKGHSGVVHAAAFLPDGKRVLSAHVRQWRDRLYKPAPEYDLRLWDGKTGQELRRLSGHQDGVAALSLSPDGKRGLTASHDGTVRLWDIEAGRELRRLAGHWQYVWSAALLAGGARAFSAGQDRTVRQWDLDTGKEVSPPAGQRGMAAVAAFSPDGRHLLAGGWEDTSVRLWDLETGKELPPFEGHNEGIWCVAFSRDCKFVFSGSSDKTLRKWEISGRKEVFCFKPHSGWVNSLAFSPDGRRALVGTWNWDTAHCWDLDKGSALGSFKARSGASCVAISPDGRLALTGGSRNTVCLWDTDVDNPRELRCFTGHTGPVLCIAVAPDGKSAASCDGNGMIWYWSLKGTEPHGRKFLKYHTASVRCVAFTLDGKNLVSAGWDGRVILWDVASGDRLVEWRFPGEVNWVALAPDGRHLATANNNGTIYVLRLPLRADQ